MSIVYRWITRLLPNSQAVERMKRLQSQKIETQIEPGSRADTSIIYIEREPIRFIDRFHGGLPLDNSGSSSLSHEEYPYLILSYQF